MDDPFNLARFVDAQDSVYDRVLSELRSGSKRSHWMWFVFPQVRGLGSSFMAEKYALSSLDEAQAYLRHTVLGPRLFECTNAVLQTVGLSLDQIFGYPDNMKFVSSMTLFAIAAGDNGVFDEALRKFGEQYDPLTLERLRS
jgi:uncharacterized protein (DUF1810 family)